MEQDKLTGLTPNPSPKGEGGKNIQLVAEEGASLSSGSLRLYASTVRPHPQPLSKGRGVTTTILTTADLPLSSRRGGQGGEASLVGCLDLYSYDPLNHRCAVGIMVATEYRRQGYALAMLHALVHSSFLTPHSSLHTLYADIAATNTASLALFQKAGYRQCGRFKDWLLVNDRYIDSIRMQLILK